MNLLCFKAFAKTALAVFVTLVCFFQTATAHSSDPGEISEAEFLASFAACHRGFSTDELMIQDELRQSFIDSLSESVDVSDLRTFEREALLRLLNLRKAGKMTARASERGPVVDESVFPVAEIAARVVTDRHRITTDYLLADPIYRDELGREAEKLSPTIDRYAVRKAVLSLRKRRALKPELVLRVADWGREIKTYSVEQLRTLLDEDKISQGPGVYLFRSNEGYLYVGEAKNLSERLATHLHESDRESLAQHLAGDDAADVTVELHIFPAKSPARKVTVRRAYESELIRSRSPKFNVRP